MITINSPQYDKNLFIFGEKVKTPYGILRFLTYREYISLMSELSLISQNTLHIYYQYKKQINTTDKETLEAIEAIKKVTLYELIVGTPHMLSVYLKIFRLVFEDDEETNLEQVFASEENFNFIRKIIMDMNVLTEEKVSPNERIQKALERSKRLKQSNGEEQSFVDIVTSIVASTSNSFEDVCNMTIFQVYSIYARIGAIFNHKATTLFATVAEKVSIESWNKHIDLFESEDDVITMDEFNKKFGSLLQM